MKGTFEKGSDKFTCALCGKEYVKGWTDEEALAEAKKTFPDMAPDSLDDIGEDLVTVCSTCYQQIEDFIASAGDEEFDA